MKKSLILVLVWLATSLNLVSANVEELMFINLSNTELATSFLKVKLESYSKDVIVVTHGANSYREMYKPLINSLKELEMDILTYDLLGQGASVNFAESRGHVDSFSVHIEIFRDFIDMLKVKYQNIYLVTHSMSGLVAVHYMARFPGMIKAAVLGAPPLALPISPRVSNMISKYDDFKNEELEYVYNNILKPSLKTDGFSLVDFSGFALRHLAGRVGKFKIKNKIKLFSENPSTNDLEMYRKYYVNKDQTRNINRNPHQTVSWWTGIVNFANKAPESLAKVETPLKIILGGSDPLIDFIKVEQLCLSLDRKPNGSCDSVFFYHNRHNQYLSLDREDVFKEVKSFINSYRVK